MRLSELKALVDKASERMAKHREDPEVAMYFLENGPGEQRHHILHVELADLNSVSNIEANSMDLLASHELTLDIPMRTLFVLTDDADAEIFN